MPRIKIVEQTPCATPCIRFTLSALFTLTLASITAPVAAQLAMDITTNASGTTITGYTGYTANCAVQTANVPVRSTAIAPDVASTVANQPMCSIARRITQAHSDSNAESAAEADQSTVTIWGGGYYDNDIDGESFSLELDGRLRTAYFGLDTRLRDNLLAGLMVSRSEANIGYTAFTATTSQGGDYDVHLTSANPYISWNTPDGRLDLWGMTGYGEGDVDIIPNNTGQRVTADLTMRTISVGGSRRLLKRGTSELRLKADALQIRYEVENGDVIVGVVKGERIRVAVEAVRIHTTVNGVRLEPSVDLGVRFDDRDGETGTGIEVGVGLRYTDPALGLTVDFNGRTLIRHNRGDRNSYENYYNEWDFSIGGSLRPVAGTGGQGLSFSVFPDYGKTADDGQAVWRQGLLNTDERKPRMNTRISYGLPSFGGGQLTPYGETTLGGANKIHRLGVRWELGSLLDMELAGERREKENAVAGHAVLLTGEVRF